MDSILYFFSEGAYVGWILLAIAAVALEIFTGTMIFLSLAVAAMIVSVVSWLFAPGLALLLLTGTVAWVVASLVFKNLFGSWGASEAAEDPNEYDRSSSATQASTAPTDEDIGNS